MLLQTEPGSLGERRRANRACAGGRRASTCRIRNRARLRILQPRACYVAGARSSPVQRRCERSFRPSTVIFGGGRMDAELEPPPGKTNVSPPEPRLGIHAPRFRLGAHSAARWTGRLNSRKSPAVTSTAAICGASEATGLFHDI